MLSPDAWVCAGSLERRLLPRLRNSRVTRQCLVTRRHTRACCAPRGRAAACRAGRGRCFDTAVCAGTGRL
eukprot:4863369-Prymnesium_polylepis.3